MKKLLLAGFWLGQYGFGAAAIIAMHNHIEVLPIALLVASYFSTIVGGKLLGIGQELQARANEKIPRFLEIFWRITCVFVILLLALNMGPVKAIGGFHVQFTSVHALIILYVAAALRDVVLIRFYFSQDF